MKDHVLELENFDQALSVLTSPSETGDLPDPDRMAAFDEGYAAGWEDAENAARAEQVQAETALRSRLQDLSFSFHEARAHVMRMLHPLLNAIVDQAVPELLQKTLGHRLLAEIESLAASTAEQDIELLVAPGHADAARNLMSDVTALPVTIAEDPTLMAGQIHLRLGEAEREIDLDTLISTLRDALCALDEINKETLDHG